MITVNLLPFELRPIKRTPIPYMLSVAVLAVVVFVVLTIFVANQRDVSRARAELQQHRNELSALQAVVEEYNTLSQKKRQLANQVSTINEIVSDRIIWSRQLHNLARLALENLWYDGIRVGIKPFTEMRSVYNPQTEKSEIRSVTSQRQVLTVSGYVMAGTDGKATIGPFTKVTEEDPEFSSLFQLDRTTFEDAILDDVSVRKFEIEYVVSSGGASQ